MIFFATLIVLGVSVALCLVRAIKGPTPFDRILSISSIGTIIAIGISVHGFAFDRPDFVDISLMYILLNFLGTIAILRYYKIKEKKVMSYNYIDLISLVLLAIGCFFILSGSLGLIKLPDVFSRIHAAGLIDTLGSGFIVLALIVYSGFSLLSLKLLLIPLFLIFTSPVTGHAIALFAHESGYKPKGKNKK